MGRIVRSGTGGGFPSSPNTPAVELAIGGPALGIDNGFSAPAFDTTVCRRSACGGFLVGKLSVATNLHLSCRGVSVGCASTDAPVSFGFGFCVRVPPPEPAVSLRTGGVVTPTDFGNGLSGSCLRLLPGFTVRCR